MNILSSNLMSSVTNIFMNKKEKHFILDPFSCLVKLSLLKYFPLGTKICIYDNKLCFNEPNMMQGVVRFMYGDGREDLHNLYQPIRKCAKWYWDDNNMEIKYLFQNAVEGIKNLKASYSSWATIQHTLDYYIILLVQNDSSFFSNYIREGKVDFHHAKKDINKSIKKISKPKSAISQSGEGGNDRVNRMRNEIEDKVDLDEEEDSEEDSTPIGSNMTHSIRKAITNRRRMEISESESEYESKNPISKLLHHSMRSENKSSDNSGAGSATQVTNSDSVSNDVQKYLKSMWTDREIQIIINLFHELDSKTEIGEKGYIQDNIMNYCMMKENKLNKYIEESSKFLQKP